MKKAPKAAHAPEHLDATARAKWAEVWPIVAQRANIDQGTLDALAAYCQAYSRWTAAETKVNELGAVVKSPAGFAVPNPYLAVAAQAQRQMRQWAQELRRR
jgi:P27 family predicted phage terminase small subunit